MIKYEDYFPKSVLNKCGVLPQSKLLDENELNAFLIGKTEKDVSQLINDIYANLKKSSVEHNISKDDFRNFNINQKIVAMLCDLDVISSMEKDLYLQKAEQKSFDDDYIKNDESRVRIELPELDTALISGSTEKSKMVTAISQPELELKGKQK